MGHTLDRVLFLSASFFPSPFFVLFLLVKGVENRAHNSVLVDKAQTTVKRVRKRFGSPPTKLYNDCASYCYLFQQFFVLHLIHFVQKDMTVCNADVCQQF